MEPEVPTPESIQAGRPTDVQPQKPDAVVPGVAPCPRCGKPGAGAFAVLLGSLPCFFFPAAVVALGYRFGHDRLHSDSDFSRGPVYAVDTLFWIDTGYTAAYIWLSGRWRWLTVLVSSPLLVLNAVLTVTGGMWIEGTYF